MYIYIIWHFEDFTTENQVWVAETSVWPITFLINMLAVHKGSRFYFYSFNEYSISALTALIYQSVE